MRQATCSRSTACRSVRAPGRASRRGFSLVEAIVALSITSMAGAVLLLGVESNLDTNTDSVHRTVADGMAQQLLDEICNTRFAAIGADPLDNTFGPSGTEASGAGRERYNDSDDFDGFSALPAEDRYGDPLGTGNDAGGQRHPNLCVSGGYFDRWRQRVEVYFVDASDHRVASGASYYRAIEVHIERVEDDGAVIPLATRKRVIAYVQPPS